ncbi:methylated-DNA--protein-cysteine methyltransferase [Clupea harengus]|uniref:Methylated-DNA--protein-cysteine methyltransferase n=1 Tax=Clupea harengus TaxID=7950 RepID=A0A8M1KSX2_CLUHA|nr:methylated-DNA--protein-cysteine methyltransferase [Clupea harengus]
MPSPSRSQTQTKLGSACEQQTVSLKSPLGLIHISSCREGTHTIQISPDCSDCVCGCVCADDQQELFPECVSCVTWLKAYFSDPNTTHTLPSPTIHHPILQGGSWTACVLRTLQSRVCVGETVSYARLAQLAGRPRAARAVGGAMRKNPVPLLIPCHRVCLSSGGAGHYMGGHGDQLKLWLLEHERNTSQ